MALLTLRNIRMAFGGPVLLDGADLHIERGERICLIGRNGAGKSTLLRLVHGEHTPDDGTIHREQGLRGADEFSDRLEPLYHDLDPGQYLLLCCDGLWDKVSDEEMSAIVTASPTPGIACRNLVARANENGGEDNISVILAARGWPLLEY